MTSQRRSVSQKTLKGRRRGKSYEQYQQSKLIRAVWSATCEFKLKKWMIQIKTGQVVPWHQVHKQEAKPQSSSPRTSITSMIVIHYAKGSGVLHLLDVRRQSRLMRQSGIWLVWIISLRKRGGSLPGSWSGRSMSKRRGSRSPLDLGQRPTWREALWILSVRYSKIRRSRAEASTSPR